MSLEYLRLLISDTEKDDEGNYIFTDDQLNLYLENTKNIYYAAAFALRTIAANEVLILKWVRTDDLQVDGPAVSKELRLLALDYENQGKSEDNSSGDNFGFAYIPGESLFHRLDIPEASEPPWCR